MAHALARNDARAEITNFLRAGAVLCAKAGQKTPDGYYNLERMIRRVLSSKGRVLMCGTCMDARGLADGDMMEGRSDPLWTNSPKRLPDCQIAATAHTHDAAVATRNVADCSDCMGTSPMSLVVNSAARIPSVFSSIPTWILHHTWRLVPPCLRLRRANSPGDCLLALLSPFTFALDLDACAVDWQVQRPV